MFTTVIAYLIVICNSIYKKGYRIELEVLIVNLFDYKNSVGSCLIKKTSCRGDSKLLEKSLCASSFTWVDFLTDFKFLNRLHKISELTEISEMEASQKNYFEFRQSCLPYRKKVEQDFKKCSKI